MFRPRFLRSCNWTARASVGVFWALEGPRRRSSRAGYFPPLLLKVSERGGGVRLSGSYLFQGGAGQPTVVQIRPIVPLRVVGTLLKCVLQTTLSVSVCFPVFLRRFPSIARGRQAVGGGHSPISPGELSFFCRPNGSLSRRRLQVCQTIRRHGVPLFEFTMAQRAAVLPVVLFVDGARETCPDGSVRRQSVHPAEKRSSAVDRLIGPGPVSTGRHQLRTPQERDA